MRRLISLSMPLQRTLTEPSSFLVHSFVVSSLAAARFRSCPRATARRHCASSFSFDRLSLADHGLLNFSDSPPHRMDYDSLKDLGSGLGTGAVIVLNQQADVVAGIARFAKFYKHESCGQCTPCREGTTWMANMMSRFVEGRGSEREIDMLLELTKQVEGHTYVPLSPFEFRSPSFSPLSFADLPPSCLPLHACAQYLRSRRCRRLADPGPDEALPSRGRGAHSGLPRDARCVFLPLFSTRLFVRRVSYRRELTKEVFSCRTRPRRRSACARAGRAQGAEPPSRSVHGPSDRSSFVSARARAPFERERESGGGVVQIVAFL